MKVEGKACPECGCEEIFLQSTEVEVCILQGDTEKQLISCYFCNNCNWKGEEKELINKKPISIIKTFHLLRHEDESGVSGEGIVAVGARFPSGKIVMEWTVPSYSWSVHWSIESVEQIHGHDGKTEVVWDD